MVRLADLDSELGAFLRGWEAPEVPGSPWTAPVPSSERRVALISSAGLKLPSDRPFAYDAADYRVIPADRAGAVVMDHVSTSHDRTGFQQDVNTVFPLDRLSELARAGEIGSVAEFHYSFMGATDPRPMEGPVRRLAGVMKQEGVNTVVLAPV